tara:strand:- start:35 stop:1066 length:1032 start_codon:yes stop_codon:yes gene_type:complete
MNVMNKLQVNVIGAGHWGPNVVGALHGLANVEVRTVCDLNESALKKIRQRFPTVETTTDTQETLADREAHAICIATPVSSHFELALAALANGKHVMVEKPLCTTSAECLILEKEAARRNLVLMVGHVFLFNPSIIKVKQILQSGELGNIFYMEAHRTNLGPVRQDVNAIWDLTSHDISIFNFLLDNDPLSASAVGSKALDGQVEDTTFCTLKYPKGVLAHAHASWLNPKKVRQITIVGERKMLTWDDIDITHPIRIYDSNVTLETQYSDSFAAHRMNYHRGDVIMPQVEGGEPLRNECKAFADSILKSNPAPSDGKFGRKVVEALEAIDRSLQAKGTFVEINN